MLRCARHFPANMSSLQMNRPRRAGGGHDCTMYAGTLCVDAMSFFGACRTCEGMRAQVCSRHGRSLGPLIGHRRRIEESGMAATMLRLKALNLYVDGSLLARSDSATYRREKRPGLFLFLLLDRRCQIDGESCGFRGRNRPSGVRRRSRGVSHEQQILRL